MSQSLPLGTSTLKEVYYRAYNRVALTERTNMPPDSVLAIMKRCMNKVFMNTNGAFDKDYYGEQTMTVLGMQAATAGVGTIALTSGNKWVRITSIVSATGHHKYDAAPTIDALHDYVKDSVEHNNYRSYFYERGANVVSVMQGAPVAGNENSVIVYSINYPYTGFSAAEVEAGTQLIDMPDLLVSFVEDLMSIEIQKDLEFKQDPIGAVNRANDAASVVAQAISTLGQNQLTQEQLRKSKGTDTIA